MEQNKQDQEAEILAYNIKWLRITHKISKRKMARMLEIGVGSLNELEKGIIPSRLRVNFLYAVHKCFGICPSELFNGRIGEK